MPEEKRVCLFCGKKITGRPDKLYCNDICRTGYLNEQKRLNNIEIRTINLALKKNWNILKRLLGEKEAILVSEQDLVHSGFLFDYHTHFIKSKSEKNPFTFCFNYGYVDIGIGRYKVMRKWSKN
jgi:hypothetical protein